MLFLKKNILSIVCLLTMIDVTIAVYTIDIYQQNYVKLKNFEINAPVTNESVVLYKFMDSEYYGLIRIGKPAKQFKMIFDTNWADSWVPSERCSMTEIACMIHNRYDNTKSSTYQADGRTFNFPLGNSSLEGFLSRDDFHLDHKNVTNQTFIEMTKMPIKYFLAAKADGIIGLGFQSLSKTNTIPFFYNLVKQGVINRNVFTFYMNRDESTEKAGKLILGGTAREHVKGEIHFEPVTEKLYWKVTLARITLESKKKSFFITENVQAIMDSSTNLIRGPREDIIRINTLLNAKDIAPQFGRYIVNCREYAKLPLVHFMFGNRTFTIESKYYVQRMTFQSVEICLSPFMPSEDGNIWEMGGAFLMQFYTEYYFDGRIGIGQTVF